MAVDTRRKLPSPQAHGKGAWAGGGSIVADGAAPARNQLSAEPGSAMPRCISASWPSVITRVAAA